MFVFLAIIGLSVLVFFHELGHFLLAKIFKIRVEEFGIGYPPRIFGLVFLKTGGFFKKKKLKIKFFLGNNKPAEAEEKTIYSLNWIPFGGLNKIKGELGEENKDRDSFFSQVWWKKALVASGGFLMNIILAFAIFSFCYLIGIPRDIEEIKEGELVRPVGIQIAAVIPNSPAERAELAIGDIILGVNGEKFEKTQDIQDYIKPRINNSLEVKIKRKIKKQEMVLRKIVEVVPVNQIAPEIKDNYGAIGIVMENVAIVSYPFFKSVFLGIQTTVSLLARIFSGLWLILKSLIVNQKMIGQMIGPVGLTAMVSRMAQIGFVYFLQFLAILSVAIGAFQIIPFPALDGSRVLLAFIEGIRKKPMGWKLEAALINIGFYILLLLLLFVTFKDIASLFN